MRQLLTLILTTGFLTTFGQTNLLSGTYSDTLVNHKIILFLQDNEEFKVEEFLKEGRRTLFGNWTFRDNMITLRTAKILAWDRNTPNEKKEFFPTNFPEMFVSVDGDLKLTLLAPKNTEALDIRLERVRAKNR